jgi:hypothetical protein
MRQDLRNEIRTGFRRFAVIWLISSCVIFAAFIAFWAVRGLPSGPDGLGRTFAEVLIISVVTPPIIWLTGKVGFT